MWGAPRIHSVLLMLGIEVAQSTVARYMTKRAGAALPRLEDNVQRLFERAGTTFTEFMLEQRLLLARKMLIAPGNRHSKISAIASDAGLCDLSYFNRVFRRRFNATPSELRNNN